MKKLWVYADFDWLKEIEPVGELSYESLRGSDNYSFTFNDAWLKRFGNLFLSADLNNYPGRQYTQPGSDLFGCFSDALPDRWGRMLFNRREQIVAMEEKRPVRRLTSFDYLTGIDDFSRMGGFRFKESPEGDFINSNKMLRIPPLTDVHDLIRASREIERSEEANQLPDMKWIAQLVHTLLSRRFDRTDAGRRIHFASAMTLLGLSDGDDAGTGHGYLDIVDFILQGCTNVDANLKELYRRVAFNISVGNSDDHFRNHGFLLTARGWTLSPAYDMNPTVHAYQSLLIDRHSNKADLQLLLDACEDYMLDKTTASQIIAQVVAAVKGWQPLATRLGITRREMDIFGEVFERTVREK
jgi:hypothetical protein